MSNPFRDENPGGNLSSREEDLERREREVLRREQQVEYRERKVGETQAELGLTVDRRPNWPKFKPMIYHSIKDDIPEDGQQLVKRVYFAFYLSCGIIFLNIVGTLARLASIPKGDSSASAGSDFGISIAEGVIGPFIYFVFWYRPLYKAVRNDASISYFIFLFCFAWHIAYTILMAVGIPGSSGFINAFKTTGNIGAFIVMLIVAGCWCLVAVYHIWQYKGVIQHYRSKGGVIKAKEEARDAAFAAAQSNAGRQVIAEAGKSAASAYVASDNHV